MNSSIHTTSYCTWTYYTIASIDLGLVPFLSLDSVWWPFLFILRKVLLQSVCWTIVGECVIRWTRNDGHEDLFVLRYDELVQISCRVTMEIEQRPDSLLSFHSFDLVLLSLWNKFKKKKRVKTIRTCYKDLHRSSLSAEKEKRRVECLKQRSQRERIKEEPMNFWLLSHSERIHRTERRRLYGISRLQAKKRITDGWELRIFLLVSFFLKKNECSHQIMDGRRRNNTPKEINNNNNSNPPPPPQKKV